MRESEAAVLLQTRMPRLSPHQYVKLDAQTGSADPRCCKNQKCDHCAAFLSEISRGIISKVRAIGKNEKAA